MICLENAHVCDCNIIQLVEPNLDASFDPTKRSDRLAVIDNDERNVMIAGIFDLSRLVLLQIVISSVVYSEHS